MSGVILNGGSEVKNLPVKKANPRKMNPITRRDPSFPQDDEKGGGWQERMNQDESGDLS